MDKKNRKKGKIVKIKLTLCMLLCVVGMTYARNLIDDIYVNSGVGFEKVVGEDSTAFGTIGFNSALPLVDGFGFQLGGDIKFRENDNEYDVTTGIFKRRILTEKLSLATLVDYRHTSFNNDLLQLRPIVGYDLDNTNAFVLTGAVGLLNDKNKSFFQETIDRAQVSYVRRMAQDTVIEVSAGYLFSGVDEPFGGVHISRILKDNIAVNCGAEVNGNGNYIVGVGLTFGLGQVKHITVHNVFTDDIYTPFPQRSQPSMLHLTKKIKKSDDDNGDNGDNGNGGNNDSRFVTICHIPPGNPSARHTIRISRSALPAHLAHGDTLGACN